MADDHAEKENRMALTMTRVEREAFLADLHVGMISIAEEGRGPLTVPIWYAYAPGGELRLITGRNSRKGRLLTQAGRFSLCVQTETPPYRYVSVEGPITATEAVDVERDLRPLAHRYLGAAEGDSFVEQTRRSQGDSILIRMRPQRWLTADYSKASV
jgi:nitroimidazol reductase NimA-like FMN-containing flavoprotein (pyridoxamine 5'-phosphate oxidase superfamily)